MVRKENGRTHVEVTFFDGIYEVVRSCYHVHNSVMFRIIDCCEGETYVVTKGYKDHVSYYFDLDTALSIMEETGNMEISDRLWLVNQVKQVAKCKLSSVYGVIARR